MGLSSGAESDAPVPNVPAGGAGPSAALHLFAWLSPGFPVGAFAYSHGLEAAVEAGLVHDAASLQGWLTDLLRQGSARQDAVLTAEAWRAAHRGDDEALLAVNALALALCPSRERRLESAAMGRAFVEIFRAAWGDVAAPAFVPGMDVAYPVAFGAAAGRAAIDCRLSLEAAALAFASNLVSAAVRLGPIGQTDAQRIVRAMMREAEALAAWAVATGLDDLGGCAFRSDLAALHHETQYSRLFRS